MRFIKPFILSVVGSLIVLSVSAQSSHAFGGVLYFDSPTVSEIPTDGTPIEMRFKIGEMTTDSATFVHWEFHTVGEIIIETWSPQATATCRSTPNLCTIESENEFLGTTESRVWGSFGRGSTGFGIENQPYFVGTVIVSASGPGFIRVRAGATRPCCAGADGPDLTLRSLTDNAVAFGECNDGIDNDADTQIDTDDSDCTNSLGLSESPDQDGDGIPDATDPFPADPDNVLAQCEDDLGDILFQLDECLALPKFDDDDADGEENSTDLCVGTLALTEVDSEGCSLTQFCDSIDTSTKVGERICKSSDWLNDEAITGPKDCGVLKQGRRLPTVCVPVQ